MESVNVEVTPPSGSNHIWTVTYEAYDSSTLKGAKAVISGNSIHLNNADGNLHKFKALPRQPAELTEKKRKEENIYEVTVKYSGSDLDQYK